MEQWLFQGMGVDSELGEMKEVDVYILGCADSVGLCGGVWMGLSMAMKREYEKGYEEGI